MIDHCISTLKKEKETAIFKNYVTDSLRNIGQMVAALGQGKYDVPRYAELIEVSREPKEERTAEEVIDSISDKLARM